MEIRVSLASITDQLTQMEARFGAKLNTVEVQTEYVDEEETSPWSLLLLKIYILFG